MAQTQIQVGKVVYEVSETGLARLKTQLSELASKQFRINMSVRGTQEIDALNKKLQTTRDLLEDIRKGFGMPKFPGTAPGTGRGGVPGTKEAERAASRLDDQMKALRNRVQGLRNEFVASGGDINIYTRNLKNAQREALELAKEHDRSSRAFAHLTGTAAQAQRGVVSALRAQASAVTPLQEQIAKLQNQVHGLRNQYIATGGSADTFATRMRRVRDEALQASRGLAVTSKEFRQLQTVAAQAERAATQATGGISRLGLASQVRAGMFGPGGLGSVLTSAVGMIHGPVGRTAYYSSVFGRQLSQMNAATAVLTTSTLALGGAMGVATAQASRLQKQQTLLEAITLQNKGAYDELTQGILDLSTVVPASAMDLYDAAEVASKLGVDGAQNILEFTKAIQGLAYITKGNVGQIGSDLAKFMNELGLTPDSPDYLDQLHGVVNALAAVHTTSAAMADETLTLTRYFAAIASQVGLTASEIIALSGSLVALGSQAQSGGTNLAKFFLDMAQAADKNNRQLAGMAEIAGMTRSEFRRLVRSDIVEAFLRIARGLNEAHGDAAAFARAMDSIGASNQRLIRVLGQASVGQESFLDLLERTMEAEREKTYLDDVMAQATQNLNDQTILLFNTLKAMLSLMGMPVVEQLTDSITRLRDRVNEVYERVKSLTDEERRAVAIAGQLVLGVTGVTVALGLMSSMLGVVFSGFRNLALLGALVFSPTVLWIAGVTAAIATLRTAWKNDWLGMQTAATSALDAVVSKWNQIRARLVGVELLGPGSEPGSVRTYRIGGAGSILPDIPKPNWAETIRDARGEIEAEWDLLTAGIQPLSIPPINTGEFFASWESFRERVESLEPPELPEGVQTFIDHVTQIFSRSPVTQATLEIQDIVTQYREGEIDLKDALEQAMNRDVSVALGALTALVLPIPWPLKIAAAAVALIPSEILSVEGITEFATRAWETIQDRLHQWFRRPIDAESLVVNLAKTEFAGLDEALGDVDLTRFMLRLGMTESGLKNVANGVSSATGEFQLLADTRKRIEGALGPVDWDDDVERMRASFHWLRMGIDSEMDTIRAAAERLGIDLEEALHLWWVVGGPRLGEMQDLSEFATTGVSAGEILKRRLEQELPEIPGFDLMATIREIPLKILDWSIDLDPKEDSQNIVDAIGQWIGEAAVYIAAGVASLGYVVGRDIGVPFATGLVRGMLEGVMDLAYEQTGIKGVLESEYDRMAETLGLEEFTRTLVTIARVGGIRGEEGFSKFLDDVSAYSEGVAGLREEIEELAKAMGLLEVPETWWDRIVVPWWRKITGFHDGAILPGTSGPDQFLAMLAPGEAVVPSKAVRGGWPAVLEWFRSQGVPGFQLGKAPAFGATTQVALDYASAALAQAEAGNLSIKDQIKQGFAEAIDLLGRMLEQGGKAIFGEEFYNTATQWLQDFRSALGILTGQEPARPTATLVFPPGVDDPRKPDPEVRTMWQRFMDWLRQGWKNILDQAEGFEFTWSDAANFASTALQSFANSVRSSESAFVQSMGEIARSIRFTETGSFDLGGTVRSIVTNAITFIVETATSLFTTTAESLKAQSTAYQRIGPGEDVLAIQRMFEDMRNVEENRALLNQRYEELAEQHRKISGQTLVGAGAGATVGAIIGNAILPGIGGWVGGALGALFGGSSAKKSAENALAGQMNLTKKEIADLESRLTDYVQKLRQALGLTANDFANAVQRSFSAVSFEDMETSTGRVVDGFKTRLQDAVNDIIRGALVQQFIATVVAQPIENLAKTVFEQIVGGLEPDMEEIQSVIETITDQAEPFYEMLERLGLEGNKTADALARTSGSLLNIPSGFKYALERFEAITPQAAPSNLPSYRIPPAVPLAPMMNARGGRSVEGVADSQAVININGDVYGWDDFERKVNLAVAKKQRSSRSSRYGF